MIFLDMIGSFLFKWGYCKVKGGVLFKENMVVVLVMLVYWFLDNFFVDLVCGLGMILIEVVLLVYNIVLGFNCDFVCESWVNLVLEGLLDVVCDVVEDVVDYDVELDIYGYDID